MFCVWLYQKSKISIQSLFDTLNCDSWIAVNNSFYLRKYSVKGAFVRGAFVTSLFNKAEDIDKILIHVSNVSRNIKNKQAIYWSHTELIEQLKKEGVSWEPIWKQIKDIATKIQIMSERYYRQRFLE